MGEAKRAHEHFLNEQKKTEVEWVVREIRPLVIVPGEPDATIHVLPAQRVPENILADRDRAHKYFTEVKKAGDPLVMFGPVGNQHLYSYWGHDASPDCKCSPHVSRDGDKLVYTHKA